MFLLKLVETFGMIFSFVLPDMQDELASAVANLLKRDVAAD